HDGRHRADVLGPRVAGLSDRRDHIFDLRLLDADDDRRVARLEETALRMKARHPVLLVGDGTDERTGIFGVDDRDDELHPGGTIPSLSRYPATPSRATTSRLMSFASAASSPSPAITTKRRGSAAASRA